MDLLLELETGFTSPANDSLVERTLLAVGFLNVVDDSISKDQTILRYQRNPFEHIIKRKGTIYDSKKPVSK